MVVMVCRRVVSVSRFSSAAPAQGDRAHRVEPAVDQPRFAGRAAHRKVKPMIVHRAQSRDQHATTGKPIRDDGVMVPPLARTTLFDPQAKLIHELIR